MTIEKFADKVIETDVLVIGGGIAGCPVAYKAAEHGLSVTLLDKSNVARSGSSAVGIDHYGGAYERGMSPQEFWDEWNRLGYDKAWYFGGPFSDHSRLYRLYANGMWAIEELEKMGVNMRWYDGKLRYIKSVRDYPFLRIQWYRCKPEMAAAVKKIGVNVLHRTMAMDLLTKDGQCIGATAYNGRTGEYVVIKAKATVMATAACSRIYNPETPVSWTYKFRYHWCPASVSGDGWAMAYRAGAELANMEMTERGYRYRDDLCLSQGNRNNEGISANQFTWNGEPMWGRDRKDLEDTAKTPIYVALDNLPEDFHKRIELAYVDERMISFPIAEKRGFNPRTHWYEQMDDRPFQLHVMPGITADKDFKATIPGLYAAGDCIAGQHDVANAATSGFLIGDQMPEALKDLADKQINMDQVEAGRERLTMHSNAPQDTPPMEVEAAIRYICERYIGTFRQEGKLYEGMRRLASLKREFLSQVHASNPHYMVRALELHNLFNMAEVHMSACFERKESRGFHRRVDFPEQDPKYDDLNIHHQLVDGKTKISWKKPAPLDMTLKEDR